MAIKIKALERFASSIREQAQALKTWPFGVLAPPIAPEDAVGPQRPKKGRHNPGWGVSPINSGSHQITKPRRGGMVSYRGVAYRKTLVARMVSNGTDLNCIFRLVALCGRERQLALLSHGGYNDGCKSLKCHKDEMFYCLFLDKKH